MISNILRADSNPLFLSLDTGVGIDDKSAPDIFQPFTQGDNSMSRRYGGSGLGLHISRRLAALINGGLWYLGSPQIL